MYVENKSNFGQFWRVLLSYPYNQSNNQNYKDYQIDYYQGYYYSYYNEDYNNDHYIDYYIDYYNDYYNDDNNSEGSNRDGLYVFEIYRKAGRCLLTWTQQEGFMWF